MTSQRTILKPILVTVLIFNMLVASAQLDIHYFKVVDKSHPNASVTNITQANNGELLLICNNTDFKYQNQQIKIIKTDLSGQMISNKIKKVENLHSVVKLLPKENNQWVLYGNTILNGLFNPTSLPITSKISTGDEKTETNSLSSKLNDVCYNRNDEVLLVYTKSGKLGKINIELEQTSINGETNWLKAISSENNEEASMMIVDVDNNVFILGKKYNDDLTSYVPIMYKVSTKGVNLWKKGIETEGEFYNHFFQINTQGNIIYACSYTKSQTGISETKIIELSTEGQLKNQVTISNFTANGIHCLDNNQYVLFGSEFLVDAKQVVTKGKYAFIDSGLKVIETKALNKDDKPDCNMSMKINTSSDFNAIKVLKNGDIALAGKIYMPIDNEANERSNHALLVIIKK